MTPEIPIQRFILDESQDLAMLHDIAIIVGHADVVHDVGVLLCLWREERGIVPLVDASLLGIVRIHEGELATMSDGKPSRSREGLLGRRGRREEGGGRRREGGNWMGAFFIDHCT